MKMEKMNVQVTFSNPLIETQIFRSHVSFKSIFSVPKWFFTKLALIGASLISIIPFTSTDHRALSSFNKSGIL